jgi:hypothetical protein
VKVSRGKVVEEEAKERIAEVLESSVSADIETVGGSTFFTFS